MAATELSGPAFQILLSLFDAKLHGYAIIKDIAERTDDEVRLTASTLYGAIDRLLKAGLIAEVTEKVATPDDDSRRRYYAITPGGRSAVRAEASRIERLAAMARAKRVLPPLRTPSR